MTLANREYTPVQKQYVHMYERLFRIFQQNKDNISEYNYKLLVAGMNACQREMGNV